MALAVIDSGGLTFTTSFLPNIRAWAFFSPRDAAGEVAAIAFAVRGRVCPPQRSGATLYYCWLICGGRGADRSRAVSRTVPPCTIRACRAAGRRTAAE